MTINRQELLDTVLQRAKRSGADSAEAVIAGSQSTDVSCREGKLENTVRSESMALNIRVFVGRRQASVSTSAIERDTIGSLVERAVSMARLAPEDPFAGLAPAEELMPDPDVDLDIVDSTKVDAATLLGLALRAEEAAVSVDGVTMCRGTSAGSSGHSIYLATTNGFAGDYHGSSFGISCAAIAGSGAEMESDFDFAQAVYYKDLPDAGTVGANAGRRAMRRIGSRKIATAKMPVVYAPRVANSLLAHFAGAVSGKSVAMATSFLKNQLSRKVFASGIHIVDDPRRRRGLGSRAFDDEGVQTAETPLVADGVLLTWLLDCATARQLKLKTNGHARRRGGIPSPDAFNLYLAPGSVSAEELIGDIRRGFYVTEFIGDGVNRLTGDYSRGAAGFLIENGELTTPVKEVSVAGNLHDIYANLTPANDLEFRYGMDAPTCRVEGLTVAGN